MSNMFSKGRTYEGWSLAGETKLDTQDKSEINYAKVVEGQYGLSVCFYLRNGAKRFFPVSEYGMQPAVGSNVNLESVVIQELTSPGRENAYKVKIV